MEEFDILQSLVTAVPAIGVLVAWLQSLRTRLKDAEEDLERLQNEYINHLKANNQRQSLLDAEVQLGQRLNNVARQRYDTIETQKIPTPDEIRRASEGI